MLDSLNEHPEEGGEQEVMQQGRRGDAGVIDVVPRFFCSQHEDTDGHEESKCQVDVDLVGQRFTPFPVQMKKINTFS